MRILVTGSRDWTDRTAIMTALAVTISEFRLHDPLVLVHGDARGADRIADEVWRSWMTQGRLLEPEVHRADWERYGKRAGLVRNTEMVDLGADVCLAFPLGKSRGTRHCMREAEKAGIPVRVYEGVPS